MAEQAPRPEDEGRQRKAGVKTLVADGEVQRPFMRGIMVHSLLARGMSFEDAYQVAGAVRERIRLRPVVTRQDLRSDDKYFADAYKVYMNLLWLGGAVGTGAGDEGGSADYKPRDVAYDILADQLQQLADAKAAFETHVATDIPGFNKKMSGKIPAITTAPVGGGK